MDIVNTNIRYLYEKIFDFCEYASLDAYDVNGKAVTYKGDDLTGRVLQHELDHLNGKLLIASLKRKERKAALKEISLKGFPGDHV